MNDDHVYYVDCDPGIDDALALTFLLRADADIVSIGVVSGNVGVAVAARNAKRLLALTGHDDIPISVGLHDPAVGKFWGGAPNIHGADGFGGVHLRPSNAALDELPAVARVIELARRYGTRLRIIALGPLTNIAAAIAQEPALPRMVGAITIMGGAYRAPGNVTHNAEMNIYADPHAASAVLAAPWRDLLLVPLDITTQHTLSAPDNQKLATSSDRLLRQLSKMVGFYLKASRFANGKPNCGLHDPLAAALAVGAITLTDAPECRLRVTTENGPSLGKTTISIVTDVSVHEHSTRIALSTGQDLTPLLLETIGCRC